MRSIAVASILYLWSAGLAVADDAPGKIPVLGWLSPATTESYSEAAADSPGPQMLRSALARHGLVDGKNIRIDMRLAEGKLERLPALAASVVREGATVILAFGEGSARAAQGATRTLPIVCVGDDLVDSGLAADLARPGRNLTGVSLLSTELDAKKIELMKELLPRARRVGVINDPTTSGPRRAEAMAEVARRLGLTLQTIDVRGPDDLEPAFRAFRTAGAEGVNIVSSPMLTALRRRLGELSVAAKVPAVCQWRNMMEAGCLASYGITIPELYELATDQIARLLKGARPADLPIEQPRKFELTINLKTARALGLTISQPLLLRADRVLQ